jgi:hypothetical protein
VADKEKALYTRSARGFEPANELAQEFWTASKIGDVVELKGSKPRNPMFHKLWWAMLGDMAANSTPAMTAEQLNYRAKVLTETGAWEREWSSKKGEWVWLFIPGSIAFAAMDETQFRAFVKKAAAALCERYFPGVVPDHFIRDFEQLAIG